MNHLQVYGHFTLCSQTKNRNESYFFFLCLFLRSLFLRLCVAILCLFRFFPQGIKMKFKVSKYVY